MDEEKMYSLSSQIFSGVKEYILNETHSDKSEDEHQNGPLGSGRSIKKAMTNGASQTEKISLHDFAYTEFEDKLLSDNKVYLPSVNPEDFEKMSFIKVKGRAIINDIAYFTEFFSKFESLTDSITYTQAVSHIEEVESQIELANSTNTTKNKRQIVDGLKKSIDIKNIKKALMPGLPSQKMVDAVSDLVSFAYQDDFEVQVYSGEQLFSSILKRECLREAEGLIVKKYGRKTEVEFVLFGIMTQKKSTEDKKSSEGLFANGFNDVRSGIMELIDAFSNIDHELSGVGENEVVVDPIALYTEIQI
nr:hypothetical protein [Marinomonas sp. ef1]